MIFQNLTSHDIARLYAVWSSLNKRCYDPNFKSYSDYGGRGITVSEAWLDVDDFVRWSSSSGYRHGLTLDRINNDGPYSPENCRWATRKEQCDNRRNTIRLTAFGETKLMIDWLNDPRCAVKRYGTLAYRVRVGWPHEKALTKAFGSNEGN